MKMPKPYTGDKPYLFVSYSHKDRDEVVSVIAHLQQLGYHVWFDDGIDPGTEYAKVIANRLKGASIFVGFLSDHFYQSRYCKGEINYAHSHDKQILTVYPRDEPMPEEFSLWYNIYQSIHKYKYQHLISQCHNIMI